MTPSRLPLSLVALTAALIVVPARSAAQVARTGVVFESFSFGSGLAFDRISELTIPISVTQRLGRRVTLDIGTAYASASVREAGSGNTITHAGFVDTDVRAAVSLIPGRLLATLVGSLPTGATEVPDTTIPLFGATATDLLGFATPSFGSGGGISAGLASAFKLGERWAGGTGASYRYGASYTPVAGGGELVPGGEIRFRLGIEGPFGAGGRNYFRSAFVYTNTGANDIGSGRHSVIGDRFLFYAAASMPLGNGNLSLWGWEMRRMQPSAPDTSTIAVTRGNVMALGARLERPLSPKLTLAPMVELRHELTGSATKMVLLGYLVRGGSDLRVRLSPQASLVVQAQLAFGTFHDGAQSVSVLGPRLGTSIEWSR